jgi:hypothetical protein
MQHVIEQLKDELQLQSQAPKPAHHGVARADDSKQGGLKSSGRGQRAKRRARAKCNFFVGQIARLLAKQPVRKIRQQYRRAPQYPMFISEADPFAGVAKPASDYTWLAGRTEVKAHSDRAAAVPIDSDGSELSGSERELGDDDEPDREKDADGVLPDALADSDSKDVKESKSGKDSKDGKESKYGKDSKESESDVARLAESAVEAHRPVPNEILFEVAVFAENTYMSEYMQAGVSRRGRLRRLSAAGAVSLFSSVNR